MARKDALLRLHQRLIAQRDSLRHKLFGEDAVSLTGASGGDEGDIANDGAASELDSQLQALESRELRAIERALDMMRTGRYGTCEICDHAIPISRLQALPFTSLCIDCQRRQEEEGGDENDFEVDWESAYEHEGRMSDKEFTLGDLDLSAD